MNKIEMEIKCIDEELLRLFQQRMICSGDLARQRVAGGLPAVDVSARREMIHRFRESGGELGSYAGVLGEELMDLAESYAATQAEGDSPVKAQIEEAMAATPALFPESALVACQGVEGAYSQQAAEKLFAHPNIMYFSNFEGVFSAIDKGLCRYGVLPLENSTAGSVNAIYDLMMKYRFSIVRSMRLKVDHNLLAKKGTKLSQIKEIFSHEQAINQCSAFLKTLGNVKVTVCENTAAAARMVAQSERSDIAALSSRSCAELYGLENLAASVQDQGNNYTRFICISKNLEIYPGASHTSVMLTLPHKPGSLYRILARINALDINLSKLESRPIPERDFEFMFYFDLETSVYSPRFAELMGKLDKLCETFQYLGSYSEVL